MRGLVVGLGVVAVLWTGLWLGTVHLAKRGVQDWIATEQRVGMLTGHEGLEVRGYPARLDVTVTAPYYADPFRGVSWTAPGLRVTMDSWRPTALRAEMPGAQTIHTPAGTLGLSTDTLAGEVALKGTDLAFDSAALAVRGLDLTGSHGAALRVGAMTLDIRRAGGPARHVLNLRTSGIAPDARRQTLRGATGPMPAALDLLEVRATLDLTAPLDRHVGRGQPPPTLKAVTLDALTLNWGQAELSGSGRVEADANGMAEGQITLTARNWPDLLAAAVDLGWLDPEIAQTWTRALQLLQDQTPDAAADGLLVARVTFAGGRTRLGPIPLGPAPLMMPPG